MSDYDYMQQRRNMIVGAFVIVGVCIFIYMVFLFGELPVVTAKFTSYTVKVKFPNAPGVEESTPVQYCGYGVGKVTTVYPPQRFQDENGNYIYQVVVDMSISNDYNNIPANSRVRLFRRGMGSSFIDISNVVMTEEELSKLPDKYLTDGMTLQGETGSGSDLIPEELQTKFKTLVSKATLMIDNVNLIIGDVNNRENLKKTVANLAQATEEATITLKQIRETTANANQKINVVSDSFIKTSDQLGEALTEIQRVVNKINTGQGTIGKLVTDDKLYYNLVESSEELKTALEKVQKVLDKTAEKGVQFKVF